MPRRILGAASVNQLPLDWEGNRKRIIDAIGEARRQGIQILCLPELCISAYGCEDTFYYPSVREDALQSLLKIAPQTKNMVVAVGLPVEFEENLYNGAALLCNGEILGITCKKNLADDGIHYEPRWFQPWPLGRTGEISIGGRKIPVGDLIYDIDDIRIGFEICEDAWVKDRPGQKLMEAGVTLILNPSASHYALEKYKIRERLVESGARSFQTAYIYANLLGNEAGRAIYDGDCLIAKGGEIFKSSPRFTLREISVIGHEVEVDSPKGAARTGVGLPKAIASIFKCGEPHAALESVLTPKWENSSEHTFEEFTRAATLGLFDYLRKSGAWGFIVSMSGGADSAGVATLCYLLVQRLLKEIGIEETKERLSYIGWIKGTKEESFLNNLLTCVYQKLPNSSDTTENAAKQVANALGAEFLTISLDDVLGSYEKRVSDAMGRKFSWEADDIALQNLQARVRSPGVWMIANVKKALLLVTSNRSEASMGYCTMDGDSSGSLAPIAGIDKHFLRQWLRWLETAGPDGYGKIAALSVINSQEPTAELRPPKMKQTDEADLMPYEVLARLERIFLDGRAGYKKTLEMATEEFGSRFEKKEIEGWVQKFFTLWSQSQWKRERYAPSFHLDTFSVDPKTWCRFPILSRRFS